MKIGILAVFLCGVLIMCVSWKLNYPKFRVVSELVPPMQSKIESLGLMHYTDTQWTLKKKIHQTQLQRQIHSESTPGRMFFQENWEPTMSCSFAQRVGPMGDGGKWVCNPHVIQNPCTVFSIGSNNDFSFESAIHELLPQCAIYTFDHTTDGSNHPPYVQFIRRGLGSADNGDGIITLAQMMRLVNHTTSIDILKIDCEGCEYSTYEQFLTLDVRQILMEIHFTDPRTSHSMFKDLTSNGYVIVHKEPNTLGCSGDCVEYVFAKMQL